MMFILGGYNMGIKIIKSMELLISFVLISTVSCSCDRSPTNDGNNNHYDPRNVSRNEGKSLAASLAVDDIGNVHLVWCDSAPGNWEILYSTKELGGNWSEPVNISNTADESKFPRIAIDPSGNLHVVWEEWNYEDGWVSIFYSMKQQGGNWTTPIKISNSSLLPDIEIDGSGNVHVTWMGWVSYRMKSAEGVWMPKEDVFQFGANPAIAVSNQGDVHIVCDEGMFGGNNIFYSTKPFGSSWTEYVNISESSACSWAPDIAVDDGNVYAAWKEAKPGVDQVFFRIYSSNGSWSQIDSLPDIVGEATGPWVTIAAKDGSLHFLWEARVGDIIGENVDIYYKARNRDGSWSESVNISNTGGAGEAKMIADEYGSLHIVWQDETPGNYDIFYTVIETR